MRTIYVDSEFHCHVANDGTMSAVETAFFDDKCDFFVEGYCLEPGEAGHKVYPQKPYTELAAAQTQYEAGNALLENAYREGVNSL